MLFEGGTYIFGPKDVEIPSDVRRAKASRLRFDGIVDVELLSGLSGPAELEINTWPADSFEVLSKLKSLRALKVEHFPKVPSLEPLARLAKLEILSLTTLPSWFNKHQVVDSFAPLAGLRKLQVLKLNGVLAADGDLAPLANLKKLRELFVSNIYPQEQLARLSGQLPEVERDWFLAPYIEFPANKCKKCRCAKVMLSGSDVGPKVICPNCQAKKFQECVRRYQAFRDS